MSIRRRPRRFEQEVWEGVRAQRVGGAHDLFSAAPIREQQTAVAQTLASITATGGERDSKVDLFTCAGGAEDFTLSFLPQPDSWNVSLSGVDQEDEVDFTITDQTLNILTAADARSGEKLRIQYDYLTGIPALPSEAFTGLIESLGPLAWYRLDDVSNGGVMTDSSGHAHHGVWNSVTSHTLTTSLVNDDDQALSMTGAGGEGAKVVSASWMNITTNLSWVIFFKTTDTSARLIAREQTSGGGQDWSIQVGSHVDFDAAGSLVASSLASGLNDNNIHMACVTYDGSNLLIYIDGVLDKNQTYSTPLGTSAYDITIGYGGGTTTAAMFTGVLDEAIIWDRVLTTTEIAAIWDAAT